MKTANQCVCDFEQGERLGENPRLSRKPPTARVSNSRLPAQQDSVVDWATIRQRLASIKQSWSEEERSRRAEQGKRRRQHLEWLLQGRS